ncbi:hypothetical protein MKY59_20235 [Paenibacillus sp. FSL W8-0426]|uniref:hypothetical protein n=1 Tax=Paenibacillus sp. FSL W8-0426 TaxID=2921714 RepID=UPI0030DCC7CC
MQTVQDLERLIELDIKLQQDDLLWVVFFNYIERVIDISVKSYTKTIPVQAIQFEGIDQPHLNEHGLTLDQSHQKRKNNTSGFPAKFPYQLIF